MSDILRFTLLGDGGSDRALLPALTWSLRRIDDTLLLAEPQFEARRAGDGLESEIGRVMALHAPDILFVHRDAEGARPEDRRREIPSEDHIVPVVPIRMTEAWLLFDELAIRRAAGRPTGRTDLDLPNPARLEGLADAKQRLHEALIAAAEVRGRKRKLFTAQLPATVHRVAELIPDYCAILGLTAFQQLQTDIRAALALHQRRTT